MNGRPVSAAAAALKKKISRRELALRVGSAIVLGTLSLLLAYAGPLTFALLILVFAAIMAWEWGRLVSGHGLDLAFAVQLGMLAFALAATLFRYPAWAALVVLLSAALVFVLRWRDGGAYREAWWSAAGVCYAGFPAIALLWIRTDAAYGWLAVLFLFVVVWTADSAAYISGRWIGGPKLAPRISPNKTWAGLIGGAAAAGMAGMVFALAAGSGPVAALGLLSLILALVSQAGDLGESALKRLFGRKDASGLIPGHGGVLDRVDGLVFAAVAAALIALLFDRRNPGQALLVWS